jgi:hypothetical protein
VISPNHINTYNQWKADWNKFARDVLKVNLDPQQQEVLRSVQLNSMTSVCSGTARGKDYVAAVAAVCFMYLTPIFNSDGKLIANTKIALTAPTDRQVGNIMYPEVKRLFRQAAVLPGRCVSYDIRTDYEEWFLTGFKASKENQEAWTGFHAVNTMFVVTEASGLEDQIYSAIEGNLQGNSRLLIVFNPNITTGYAANSQRSKRFTKFRLDSLDSINVKEKKIIIPGQVDYKWVKDKVETWCVQIAKEEANEAEGDFFFEGSYYRPNDLFRVKVRGMFAKTDEDTLIPLHWVERANENWKRYKHEGVNIFKLGVDVAGMGRDNSVICKRYDNYVNRFRSHSGNGNAEHMAVAGIVANELKVSMVSKAYIDTIGEGAGVYSRLLELGYDNAISCKFSENAKGLKDSTEVYEFENMRAYLFWCVREWLNPALNPDACLPPDDEFLQEATEIKWKFKSNGKIIIEPKEDLKKRLKRSPDKFDALANTFYPDEITDEFAQQSYEKASKYL